MQYDPGSFYEASSVGPAFTFGREAPGADLTENAAMEKDVGITAPKSLTPTQQGGAGGAPSPLAALPKGALLAGAATLAALLGYLWWKKR